MAVLLVQLQAPNAGLYSIPWTDCTEKPSEGRVTEDSITKGNLFPFNPICNKDKGKPSVHKEEKQQLLIYSVRHCFNPPAFRAGIRP